MADLTSQTPPEVAKGRLERLEWRLARLEARLGLEPEDGAAPLERPADPECERGPAPTAAGTIEARLEQNGFAIAGMVALTAGICFTLLRPHASLPAIAPSAFGLALAGSVLLAVRLGRERLGFYRNYLTGAAMVLLFLATLRLYFFGRTPVLELRTIFGGTPLVLAVAVNALLAWRSRAGFIALIALVTGCAAVIAIGTAGFLAAALPVLAVGVMAAGRREPWRVLPLPGIPLIFATYFIWAIGNPLLGGAIHYVREPAAAPGVVLLVAGIFSAGLLAGRDRDRGEGLLNTGVFLNCAMGYAVFLVHTAAAFSRQFATLQAAAFAVFFGAAVLYWARAGGGVATFIHAMTGHVALSMAILKATPMPDVFVWLSMQSIAVVATAIWFRSRLIVVANFLIYAAIVLGYMLLAERETGISIGFGLVALASGRILKWQSRRLELRTELMRNAYLLTAFVIFPYGLHHLVSASVVSLAWIGLAVAYYLLGMAVGSPKYRWMGHGTLVLVAARLLLPGAQPVDAGYRVASFLALGIVLVAVSLLLKAGSGRR